MFQFNGYYVPFTSHDNPFLFLSTRKRGDYTQTIQGVNWVKHTVLKRDKIWTVSYIREFLK